MNRLLFAILCCLATAAHAADTFTFSNPPGPHGVGLKVLQQYDHTRQYKARVDLSTGEATRGERSRPIQALVWYPAARGGTPVTFRDYLETIATEDDFTRDRAELKRMTMARIDSNAGVRRDAVLRDIARPMLAVRDARPDGGGHPGGRFPVVIYAPSFSSHAMENADLCELLASHGYLVLSSASVGARTRQMTSDLEGLEAQAADIAWLIGYARSLPQADAANVAVVGFSWGGLANVLAAAKDDRIKAIVSLDGSVRGYREFVDGGKDAAKYVTPARVAVPMLYLGRRPMTFEQMNRARIDTGYSFMNEMKYSDLYIGTMLPMKHMDFSAYSVRMDADDGFGDYTRDEISLAHSWAARYALRFLDAYLKQDAAGLAFLNASPAANRAPPHMMLFEVRRKTGGVAPTLENFVARLAAEGFDKAIPVYQEFAAGGGALKLGPDEIYGWAGQLARLERPAQAREIFRLGVHLHPKEAVLLDGLAGMQVKTGQQEAAAQSYRQVLLLDPSNAEAAKFLKERGGARQGAAP